MDGDEIVSAAVSVFVGIIVWIADSIAENAITDACFSIIYDSADTASQYDPVAGALIGLIPAVIAACLTFVGMEAILKTVCRF